MTHLPIRHRLIKINLISINLSHYSNMLSVYCPGHCHIVSGSNYESYSNWYINRPFSCGNIINTYYNTDRQSFTEYTHTLLLRTSSIQSHYFFLLVPRHASLRQPGASVWKCLCFGRASLPPLPCHWQVAPVTYNCCTHFFPQLVSLLRREFYDWSQRAVHFLTSDFITLNCTIQTSWPQLCQKCLSELCVNKWQSGEKCV